MDLLASGISCVNVYASITFFFILNKDIRRESRC